ncbi:MAG TPA: hypothetical protein VNM92_18925 [Thermoanaerobaculia bacterium]|nr:hypothetical protein [Thermoanaerobaculia bacterium]
MRIQELNEVVKESQIKRLDYSRHHPEPSSFWNSLNVMLKDRRVVQIGLGVLGLAVIATVGKMLTRRHSKHHFTD